MRRKPNRSSASREGALQTRKHRCVRRFQTSRRMRTVTCSVPRRNCGAAVRDVLARRLPLPAGAFPGAAQWGRGSSCGLVSCLAAYARGLTCWRVTGNQYWRASESNVRPINLNERTSPARATSAGGSYRSLWVVVNSASPRSGASKSPADRRPRTCPARGGHDDRDVAEIAPWRTVGSIPISVPLRR